jgi:hypothetical protein
MAKYAVTIRGLAEQVVYVKAESRSAAREAARNREFHDAQEIDFASGHPVWPSREPVDLLEVEGDGE